MNRIELYKLWAPEESLWSNWVKPVLFAESSFRAATFPRVNWRSSNVAWAPPSNAGCAIILDADDSFPVWVAMALAERGFRPVPLYNGAPGRSAIVDVGQIMGALQAVAEDLAALNGNLPGNAPPVFLLDSRRTRKRRAGPGQFDNRWVVFPQDFPSANFLKSNGIQSAVLGQASSSQEPQLDLAHVLLRWQEAGIRILACDVRGRAEPTPIQVKPPGRFRMLWYRALVLAGLRRNSAGGFGAAVPEATHSSGLGSGGGFRGYG